MSEVTLGEMALQAETRLDILQAKLANVDARLGDQLLRVGRKVPWANPVLTYKTTTIFILLALSYITEILPFH